MTAQVNMKLSRSWQTWQKKKKPSKSSRIIDDNMTNLIESWLNLSDKLDMKDVDKLERKLRKVDKVKVCFIHIILVRNWRKVDTELTNLIGNWPGIDTNCQKKKSQFDGMRTEVHWECTGSRQRWQEVDKGVMRANEHGDDEWVNINLSSLRVGCETWQ